MIKYMKLFRRMVNTLKSITGTNLYYLYFQNLIVILLSQKFKY